ncbi:ABC1 kinase family protein [Gordonia sp. CPCC 205333]|uniref:ABC1 kinase family protein n=1 Tax=Gordonia sp. CPCC 205333 TaxID=3140790 RepID=UPI003AF36069
MAIMVQRATSLGAKALRGAEQGEIDDKLINEAAEQVFAVLGELKGGAMKVGQALSVAEAAVPDRFMAQYRDALTRLQAGAPPMETAATHRMLTQQLGSKWRSRFTQFDDQPMAAASIGQVHRAVWSDGRKVAVKVQYPGAEEALMADLKMFQMFSGAFGALLPGINFKSLVDEFIASTADELDYRIESDYQRRFAKELTADDPKFFVPKLVASSPRVMVSEWMEGTPLTKVIQSGTADERNRAGNLLIEFAISSPERFGLVHCDPHPGNFQLLPDGRLGIIDFGASIEIPGGYPKYFGDIAREGMKENYDEVVEILRREGFLKPNAPIDLAPPLRIWGPLIDQLKGGSIFVSRELLQEYSSRAMNVENLSLSNALAFSLPSADAEQLPMLGRVGAGVIGICAQLGVQVEFESLLERWLPGYSVTGS